MKRPPSKTSVWKTTCTIQEEKCHALTISLDALNESMLNETKSSAGDKHETSRAMVHIEMENLSKSLREEKGKLDLLKSFEKKTYSQNAQEGNLIVTDKGIFYLSISIGKIEVESQLIVCISLRSPLGQVFFNKKTGETFPFNGIEYKVEQVL